MVKDCAAKDPVPERRPSRVLLVSDDEELCGLLRSFLGHAGFCVFVATGADRAESRFLSNCEIDVWIVDVQALGIEGVCLAMRLRDLQPNQPLVILGQRDSDECSLLEFVCSDWTLIAKPVAPAELLSAIHSALLRLEFGQSGTAPTQPSRRPHRASERPNPQLTEMYRSWVSAAVLLARFKRAQN